MSKGKTQRTGKIQQNKHRVPIDELLEYWISLSKRQNFTFEDLSVFLGKAEATYEYFHEYYQENFMFIDRALAAWRRPPFDRR